MNLPPVNLRRLEPVRAGNGGTKFRRRRADRGDAKGWVARAVDVKPNFTDDLSPLPAAGHSALWTYRAIYLLNDADFGQWSDAVSVTVAGQDGRHPMKPRPHISPPALAKPAGIGEIIAPDDAK